MSDYFNKDPKKNMGQHSGANPWQQDPFAPYDDPAMNPSGTGASLDDDAQNDAPYTPPAMKSPDYSAWRRPTPVTFDAPQPEDIPAADTTLPEAYRPRPTGIPSRKNVDPAMPDAYQPRPQGAPKRPDFSAKPSGLGGRPPVSSADNEDYGIVSADRGAAPQPTYSGNNASYDDGGLGLPPYDNSFATLGADAPTRIARPLSQTVNKHKSVDRSANLFDRPQASDEGLSSAISQIAIPATRPVSATPAAPETDALGENGAPRRRRATRAARYEENPESPNAANAAPQPFAGDGFAAPPVVRERPRPNFDPFEAGDSETKDPADQAEMPVEGEEPRPVRRPAMPGERYTGARTALPQKGAPQRRDQVSDLPEDEDEFAPVEARPRTAIGLPDATADRRPARPQDESWPHPQGAPGQAPQGQRPPVRLDANGRPIPPQAQRPQGVPGQAPQGQRPPVRLDANGRPIPPQAQRPEGVPGQAPQGQRPPVRLDANGRPIPPQAQRPQGAPVPRPQTRPPQEDDYAQQAEEGFDPRRRMRAPEEGEESTRFDPRRNVPAPRPRASVNRPPYDFEDEVEEEERPHRGGVLIPLVVVLMVVGGLLAGIMLPDWGNMSGGLGTAMNKIKTSVGGVFDSIKGLVSPEEEGVKSFSVSPTTATAPVELVFNVQASASVMEIRILDQDGTELLSKTLSDSDMLDGEVTKNSKYNIWTLRYTFESAYSGVFTAQTKKKDGTWAEGMTLEQPVSIAPPAVAEPPVQDFKADTQAGTAPATIDFTMVTSLDVSAVQVVNDYGDVVAEAYLNDAGNQVTESDDSRTWSLTGQVTDAYSGSFFAAYETDTDATFTQSDYSVDVELTSADASPSVSETPAPDANADSSSLGDGNTTVGADTPDADLSADANLSADASGALAPTDSLAPEQTVSDQIAVAGTATPVPEATPAPTPLPILTVTADAAAAPSVFKLTSKVYIDTKLKDSFEREKKIVINEPYKYAVWDESGILTFRGDPFRQNSAFGTAQIESNKLTEIWKVAVEGSIKAKSGALTGVAWPGQPIIVKWPTQLRAMLALNDAAKTKQALKEVIVGAQNGKLYFLDLVTGEATREAITVDWPSNGVVSLQTNASPMLAVGQHIGVLAKKTVDNGLHLFNLLTNKELTLIKGKDKQMQSNYSGFNSAPLFDKNTGTMIVGGENGLLYTVEPGDNFDHILGSLKISPVIQKYSWLAGKQKAKNTNIDGAVAMYGSYAYFGDQSGYVQCVDVNTLAPVWTVDTGDNVDATIALDMENETTVALYTGNTILNQGRSGVCTIRRLDALTGKQAWAFTVPDLVYTTEAQVGCEASPVVGQKKISNLVFFTVTSGTKSATVYALDKATGAVKWSFPLSSPTLSSPVAVYNDAGDAWIAQAEGNGKLHLIDAQTGTEKTSMQLDGSVESSPAVYRNVLVIATTGSDTSYIYGIKLE